MTFLAQYHFFVYYYVYLRGREVYFPMKHLHSKIFVSFLVIHVIVILTIGATSLILYSSNIQNKLYDSIELSLNLTEKNLRQKLSGINRFLDYINANKNIQTILRDNDFTTRDYEYTKGITDVIDLLDTYYSNDSNEIAATLIVPFNGGYYVDNGHIDDFLTVKDAPWYNRTLSGRGRIEWYGISDNPLSWQKGKVIVVGKLIYDTKYIKDLKPLGAVFLFLDPTSFTQTAMEEGNRTGYILYDGNRNVISPADDSIVPSDYFKGAAGNFYKSDDFGENLYSYTTLSDYGWKLVQYTPYNYFISELKMIIYITLVIFLFSIIVYSFIYYFVAKKMTMPIQSLLNAMKKVSRKDFDVKVNIRSRDEIGLIANGFNDMVVNIKQLFLKVEEEEREKRRAEIRVLQYQMNPHFLFNTFNSISAIAEQHEITVIPQIIRALSELLRTVLRKSGQLIPLEEEIHIAKQYVLIQQVRYKDRIRVEYHIAPGIQRYKVPCMLLQPLIENAVTHGLSRKLNVENGEAVIRINAYVEDSRGLLIEIWDNGRGMSPEEIAALESDPPKSSSGLEPSGHIGIMNTKSRIRYLFGPEYGLEIRSVPSEYFSVLIHLPVLHREEHTDVSNPDR